MGRIIKMWPIIVAVITLVYAVGTTSTTLQRVEKSVDQNCKVDEQQEYRLTRVEEGKQNIEKRLDRIEDKLDKILRAVK